MSTNTSVTGNHRGVAAPMLLGLGLKGQVDREPLAELV
jgi:hypothetical protein